jgi:hypothetical protein
MDRPDVPAVRKKQRAGLPADPGLSNQELVDPLCKATAGSADQATHLA